MIPTETWYKTHNQKLLTIVEAFKTQCHYLESYKYMVLILTDHSNLYQFINIKSFSSCQICWAQKLSWYHFQIDYHQRNTNTGTNALSYFPQRSQAKKETFRDENSQILHHLQSSLTRANIASLTLLGLASAADLFPLHQVFICGTHVLPQLCQFWTQLWGKLVAHEGPYKPANVRGLRLS